MGTIQSISRFYIITIDLLLLVFLNDPIHELVLEHYAFGLSADGAGDVRLSQILLVLPHEQLQFFLNFTKLQATVALRPILFTLFMFSLLVTRQTRELLGLVMVSLLFLFSIPTIALRFLRRLSTGGAVHRVSSILMGFVIVVGFVNNFLYLFLLGMCGQADLLADFPFFVANI